MIVNTFTRITYSTPCIAVYDLIFTTSLILTCCSTGMQGGKLKGFQRFYDKLIPNSMHGSVGELEWCFIICFPKKSNIINTVVRKLRRV